ncbi:MAG: DUF2569 family protein [Flavobacteriales bacterium]|nr:DUF2569 family protein [Flavobacteriales bacterium]
MLRTVLLLLGLCPVGLAAQWYRIGPPRPWVRPLSVEGIVLKDTACASGGTEYLLLDRQYHLGEERSYFHMATRLVTPEGVQNGSRIEVDVDPTYQTVDLHMARIIRNGRVIDQLTRASIKVLQRESEMASHLYDGSSTVVIDLKDVRPGDIVEQAYTVQGRNPADNGKYHHTLTMGFGVPIARSQARFVEPLDRTPTFKQHRMEQAPTVTTTEWGRERVWDMGALPCIREEGNAPGWYTPFPLLEISEFKDLEDLRSWAVDQYTVDQRLSPELKDLIDRLNAQPDRKARIDSAIQIVQRHVRYLGLEDGISAYRPHPPAQVYAQRFGECKDRSLLLVLLLRNIGVDAWPALVNTSTGPRLNEHLPRPSLFDNCIVLLEDEGRPFWIDPTMTHNQGSLEERYAPDRGYALVVDPERTGWERMGADKPGKVKVIERFTVEEIGAGAELEVESRYEGREADRLRSYFAGSSIQEITEDYTDYYRNRYGAGEALEPVRYSDDPKGNTLSVHEHYRFESVWDTSGANGLWQFAVHAAVLLDHIVDPTDRFRTAPYYLGRPVEVSQHFEIQMPTEWNVDLEPTRIEGAGVTYTTDARAEGSMVYFDYTYRVDSAVVAAADMPAFVDQQRRIRDDAGFTLDHDPNYTDNSMDKFWAYGALVLMFALAVWGAIRLYHYDPEGRAGGNLMPPTKIGGWMVLPLIGLLLSPLRMLVEMFQDDMYFFTCALDAPYTIVERKDLFQLYCYGSQAWAIGMFAFTAVLIVLFFRKRTSVPILMVFLYGVTVVFLIVDQLLYDFFDLPALTGEPYGSKDLVRSIIAGCIWIPFFLVSDRVRTTFVRRLDPFAMPPPGV